MATLKAKTRSQCDGHSIIIPRLMVKRRVLEELQEKAELYIERGEGVKWGRALAFAASRSNRCREFGRVSASRVEVVPSDERGARPLTQPCWRLPRISATIRAFPSFPSRSLLSNLLSLPLHTRSKAARSLFRPSFVYLLTF